MKNKIALKLMAYFAAALTVFALLIGTLFAALFTRHTLSLQKEELKQRAMAMAKTLTTYMDSPLLRGAAGAGQGRYGMYLRMLNDIAMTDVWIVDEDLQVLTVRQKAALPPVYSDLPEDAEVLVKKVFKGDIPFSEGFSSLIGVPTLTVGAPIYKGDKVVGALLLHDAVSGMRSASRQGTNILLLSAGAALLLSVVPALLMSMAFARPLNRMKNTALALTRGEYDAKTGVTQKDEIGKLAQAIDALSGRLKEAQMERDQQEKMRRDFLANVSHELRTPVAVLRGSLEALCDGVVTEPDQVAGYHRQMLRETQGLHRLVNDLMELNRLQNTDFPMEIAVLSMNDVLSDALRSAGQMAREKAVAIETEFPPEPVSFHGDYGRLKQMFLAVLDNAIKFSPSQSTIHVTLTPRYAVIRDEGPGIAPEELSHIFDRFHRLRTEDNRLGSGLGLPIARQIALRHGVEISVESQWGMGTSFAFRWSKPGDGKEGRNRRQEMT